MRTHSYLSHRNWLRIRYSHPPKASNQFLTFSQAAKQEEWEQKNKLSMEIDFLAPSATKPRLQVISFGHSSLTKYSSLTQSPRPNIRRNKNEKPQMMKPLMGSRRALLLYLVTIYLKEYSYTIGRLPTMNVYHSVSPFHSALDLLYFFNRRNALT